MKTLKPRDYDAIKEVESFAIELHGAQKYGDRPYEFHLRQVVMALDEMGADDDEMKGGWLHDLLEDTSATHAVLVLRFGQRAADLAWAVTGVGHTREEKLQSVKKKIPTVPGSEKIKLADRYCNVRRCVFNKNWKKLKTYVHEHAELSKVLPPPSHPLRAELDRLIAQGRNMLAARGEFLQPQFSYNERFMDALEVMCTARPPEDICKGWLFGKDDERLQQWVVCNLRFNWMSGIGLIESAMHAAEHCEEGRNDLTSKEDDQIAYRRQQQTAQSVTTP